MSSEKLFDSPPISPRLKRVLGWPQLLALGIGATIGAGAFVVTGVAAHDKAGPALFISFIIAGFVCILAALCYAEFSTLVPATGSSYTYVSRTLPEMLGWMIGWDLCLEYLISTACIAQGWSVHFNVLWRLITGNALPVQISTAPLSWDADSGSMVSSGGYIDIPAIFIIVVVSYIVIRGIQESSDINIMMVFIKVSILLIVIIVGFIYFNPQHFTPFAPYGITSYSNGGRTVGVLAAASVVFFAYTGFDQIACQSEEAQNPQRTLPIAILGSVSVCGTIYVLLSISLVGMVPYDSINVKDPLPAAFEFHSINWGSPIIAMGGLIGMSSVLLVMTLSTPRILLAMSRDGFLPKSPFSYIHPATQTPHYNTLFCMWIVILLLATLPYTFMIRLCNVGSLIAYGTVCFSIPILRHTQPDLPRAFRVPLSPFVPILGALCCFVLVLNLEWMAWVRWLIWAAVGLCVYFGYGRSRSRIPKHGFSTYVKHDHHQHHDHEKRQSDTSEEPINKREQDKVVERMQAALA